MIKNKTRAVRIEKRAEIPLCLASCLWFLLLSLVCVCGLSLPLFYVSLATGVDSAEKNVLLHFCT